MKRLTILLGCALLAGCASGGLNAEGKAELKVLYLSLIHISEPTRH